MFKKESRLSKNNDFDKVFKEGKGVFSGFLGIKIIKNCFKYNRFGVLVGTKVSKKAVDRNKIKRRIRESIKKIESDLLVGYDIVITTSPGILNKEFSEIDSFLKKGLKRLKLFKNE